ncbi:hypothetical protein ACQR3P_29110 [Rhodococcus sp. IEGM1300]
MSNSVNYAAMYKRTEFGMIRIGIHKGPLGDTPMCLFSYWLAGEDKKGNPLVIRTGHWAGAEEPEDEYELLGLWDDDAEERFQKERRRLMRSVGLNPDEQIELF